MVICCLVTIVNMSVGKTIISTTICGIQLKKTNGCIRMDVIPGHFKAVVMHVDYIPYFEIYCLELFAYLLNEGAHIWDNDCL